MSDFILKGNIYYSKILGEIEAVKDGYAICINGKSKGVFEKIPDEFVNLPVYDYDEKIIIPGLCDLHIHAPQYPFRGTKMDFELLEWLNNCTFPEEMKYYDIEYAEKAYALFAEKLKKSATTRACIFATIHNDATAVLMKLLEKTGLVTYVGKVSMDRNACPELCEKTEKAAENIIYWLEQYGNAFENTKPILTPRFIPCCSDSLMKSIGIIQRKYNLPVQSHLSENPSEIELVKKLCPEAAFYADAYDYHGLFGKNYDRNEKYKTVMAHCVYSGDDEIKLMSDNGVFAAHCPTSNTNLISGIAPVRKFLENGVKTGLGSDVAGGHTESIFHAMIDAIQVSKLYYRLVDSAQKPLTFAESFYLATKGGGEFFGKTGSFEEDYEFDAVVLDDSMLGGNNDISLADRIERFAYSSGDVFDVVAKFVKGRKIY